MRFVVDTNEIFSFFNEKSKARKLSLIPGLELHSPSFSLLEIEEHKSKIIRGFSLSEAQFQLVVNLLRTVVKFTGEEEYLKFLPEAKKISPDPDDSDFFALALQLNCPIWSGDKRLKKQPRVKVLSTRDLEDELEL
ncbi:hypothetical protein KY366_00470 [Candidatus Woesearchaeota archaeon]|nr:hypothetical protein [Candidatus Woesearchaeota archaeon]